MKKKKIIAMLLCTAMVGGMVAGCGSSGSSDEGSKSAKGDAKGKVYYLNFKPEQADQWVDLAEKYTEETGGLEFMPIDLYRAKAKDFQIIDGKLMPSFASIDGMGDKAAEAVELAAKDGKYLSLDDFRQRTKVSKTVIDLMSDLGLFGDLPQSNQLSLFDF